MIAGVGRNAKFLVAILVGFGAWVTAVTLSPRGSVTSSEWAILLGVFITAAVVWITPNAPASTS